MDARIAPAGSGNPHPVLTFTYADKPQIMQVHASGGTHNHRATYLAALKKQDLRRLLGAPSSLPKQDPEIKMDQEQMNTKPFNPLPTIPSSVVEPKSWKIKIAAYAMSESTSCLRFILPGDLVALLSPGRHSIERLGDEDWSIKKDPHSTTTLCRYQQSDAYVIRKYILATRLFSVSPADAVIVGDGLLVHAPLATRRWSTTPTPARGVAANLSACFVNATHYR
jgi:hypothetical protein